VIILKYFLGAQILNVHDYFWHVSVHVYTASQINLFDIHQQKLNKEIKFKITPGL
jgi:hypothetical protein